MSPRPTLRIGSACYKYPVEKEVFMEAKATRINKAGDELVVAGRLCRRKTMISVHCGQAPRLLLGVP